MSNTQKHNLPPKWINRLLTRVCKYELLEEIEGDLLEYYQLWVGKYGVKKANRLYVFHAIKFLRPFAIKKIQSTQINQYVMFRNNLKIGWRNILRRKSLFAINTSGLSIGIATCLIIVLYVADELSFDKYNEKADRIVRVVLRGKVGGEIIKESVTPAPVAPTLKTEFPEIVKSTRLKKFGTPKVSYDNNTFRNGKGAYVDPNFFEVFTLRFIKGDKETALLEPNSIVLTEDEASKFFGQEDPIGKILEYKGWKKKYEVTGVIENVPENSHFHFDQFVSMAGVKDAKGQSWLQSNYFSYLLLQKGYDYAELERKMPLIIEKYMGPQVQQYMGISIAEFREKGNEIGLFLQPLADIHLHSDSVVTSELESGGDIKSVYIFSAIAIFMLMVASINFMNLSTAAASRRAKEVGIKKVLGSPKNQLVIQFLTESFISVLTAMALSVMLVLVALPMFNGISGKALNVDDILTPEVFLYFSVFGLCVGLLAGSYPAFYLSSFKPILALKNKFSNAGGKGIRSGLVIFQFVISVVLIIATLVVDQQMSYIQNKDIGYDKDQMLVVRESWLLGNQQNAFKEQLLNHSKVENVTMSGYIPAGPSNNSMTGVYATPESTDFRRTTVYDVDERYIPTMGMELKSGRNFSIEYGSELLSVIINEALATNLGLGDEPVGKVIKIASDNEGGSKNVTVIGVVKDFHFRPLHRAVEPLIMLHNSNSGLIIRANSADMPALVADMEKMWDDFNTDDPFDYALLDELYNQTYLKEQKTSTLLRIFAMLTIFVACLGLFGLVTFTAEQRFKEIGIRKILGSSVVQIIAMLSIDFMKLIFISFIVAFPLGFYLMNQWLQDFAYRVEIHWWILPAAGLATVLIAFTTISFKSLKVAFANPVDALRDE